MKLVISNAKYYSVFIAVITGVALVAWQTLISPLSKNFQLYFFIISIFVIGIQHGALDHLIEAEIARRKHASFHIITFLAKYGILILIYALLWYLFPQISFIIFILMSAWHFGETDITFNYSNWLKATLKLIYGICVISWILFAHSKEADDIIYGIVPAHGFIFQSWLMAFNHSKEILISCSIVIISILLFNYSKQNNAYNLRLLISLLLILTCSAVLPLLPSFALYFAGWHSVITLFNINVFINQRNNINGTIEKLWLKALPLSATAIAGLVLTGYLLQHHASTLKPLPLLFIFLSLITLPHIGVMHQLNKKLFG